MSFGAIIWLTQSGPQLTYEGNDRNLVIMISHGVARWCRLQDLPESDYVPPLQKLDNASIAAWNIWKARCIEAIEGTLVYDTPCIFRIWSDVIHTLMATWARIQGSSRAVERKRGEFMREWDHGIFFTAHMGPCWQH